MKKEMKLIEVLNLVEKGKIKELKFDILNKKQKPLYENIGGIKKWKQIIIIH